MATQTTKPGQQETSQGQGRGQGSQLARQAGAPLSWALTPGEFFRMNPFALMRRLSDEMDQFFSESGRGQERERAWVPAVEISQREGKYLVRAELPGLKPEEVKLEVSDEAIILQGERKFEKGETKDGVHMTERRYGRFYRAIPLPEGAKVEEAKARFENGMLDVTVPMEEQPGKRREIPIQGSSQTGGTERAA